MNRLQKALIANVIFSGISGITLMLLNKQIADLFGITNNTVFRVIGLVLLYFALTIGYEVAKQRRLAILWIIIQDFLWVAGSLILVLFNPFQITQTGNIIIGSIAVLVLVIGIHQARALHEIRYKKH